MSPQSHRQQIGFELGITIRQWRSRMDEGLAPLGLSQAKWIPLSYLNRAGGCLPQRQLLELVGIEGPSLVRILDDLTKMGYITRQNSVTDRRTKIIHLTDKVKPMIQQIGDQADQLREQILGNISDQDLLHFRKILQQIASNIKEIKP